LRQLRKERDRVRQLSGSRTFATVLGYVLTATAAIAQQEVSIVADAKGQASASLPASVRNRITVNDKHRLCAQAITLAPAEGTHAEAGGGATVIDISGVKNGTHLNLMCNGKSLGEFVAETTTGEAAAGTPGAISPLDCPDTDFGSVFYSRKDNWAIFVVDLLGRVLARPDLAVDEDDTVIVRVVAPEDRLSSVVVRRTSQTRVPVESRVALEKTAGGPGPTTKGALCRTKDFRLGDFQPGEGKFEILEKRETPEKLQETVRGEVTFTVTPLYTGYFSFVGVGSRAADPTFAITHRGDQQVVSASDTAGWNYRYAVFFTPYLWKRRDIEKGSDNFLQRINPTIGIALKNFSDNVFVGVSTDLGSGQGLGLAVLGGVHFAHIHELDPNAGLTLGGEFHGDATAGVPTIQRWTGKLFVGIGFDMRAMLKLIETAAGVK
jgi:hypothetical protein